MESFFSINVLRLVPDQVWDFLQEHKLEMSVKSELIGLKKLSKVLLYPLCSEKISPVDLIEKNKNYLCPHLGLWEKSRSITDLGNGVKSASNINKIYYDLIERKIFENDPRYDILILKSAAPIGKRGSTLTNANIAGFLVTKLGECDTSEFKHIPVLNLICAPKKHKHAVKKGQSLVCETGCTVVGRFLLFMYLFILKTKGYKFGLLELSGLYCNVAGLCLYSKFGFKEDFTLRRKRCFNDTNNIPMICEISKISYKQLLGVLLENKSVVFNDPADAELICAKFPVLHIREQRKRMKTRYLNYKKLIPLQNRLINEKGNMKTTVKQLNLMSKRFKRGLHVRTIKNKVARKSNE